MNVYRWHRGVSRALARVRNSTQRRAPATHERAKPESGKACAHHWAISTIPNSDIDSHDGADWRRRLLAARGEQIHIMSVERNDRCAIAILDATGVVLARLYAANTPI